MRFYTRSESENCTNYRKICTRSACIKTNDIKFNIPCKYCIVLDFPLVFFQPWPLDIPSENACIFKTNCCLKVHNAHRELLSGRDKNANLIFLSNFSEPRMKLKEVLDETKPLLRIDSWNPPSKKQEPKFPNQGNVRSFIGPIMMTPCGRCRSVRNVAKIV